MTEPVVERLGAADAEEARAIRLEALRLHPEGFCADLEAWEAKTLEQWQSLLSGGAWFGVRHERRAGCCRRVHAPLLREIGSHRRIVGMYVRAEQRGTGIADA